MEETPVNTTSDMTLSCQSEEEAGKILLAEEPIVASVEDHFTLPVASNLIRFRSRKNAARVYESKGVQMVLEESYDQVTEGRRITLRRMTDETFGAQFLRFLYSIVCSLFTGFFFVFCLQVLLFLVLDLAVESGATEINARIHVGGAMGVTLAIIVFVHAFSEAMVICGHYVSDMWTGHFLAKQVIFKTVSHVAIEWIFFVAFLFVPLLVMCITLLMGRADWWTITALTWFSCVMIFFAFFCYGVVYYEVQAAYHFAENSLKQQREINMNESQRSTSTVPNPHGYRHVVQVLMHCVLMRQRHFYSGSERRDFLARNFFNDLGATNDISQANIHQDTKTTTLSWWAKITTRLPDSVFRQLEKPYRLYTLDDVRDYRPFLTESTWSLEKIFCRPRKSRYIAIVKGPGALSKSQIHSSLFCSMIGTCIILVVVVSFLVWCNIPGPFIFLVIVIAIIAARNVLVNMRNLLRVGNDLIDSMGMELGTTSLSRNRARKEMLQSMDIPDGSPEQKDRARKEMLQSMDIQDDSLGQKDEMPGGSELNDKRRARENPFGKSKQCWDRIGAEPSEAVFLVTEYKRVNEVSQTFSWVMFYLELAVFIIFPAGCLLAININMAILFGICAVISAIRHYINAAIVIEESGNIDLVGGDTEEERWENKSRLVEIVDAVTVGKSRKVWVAVLGTVGFGVMAIFFAAVGMSTETTENRSFKYLPNFYYPLLEDDMRYPTCTLSNMHGGFAENSTLADFAFLSSIAYGRTEEGTNKELKQWFGHDGTEAVDYQEYVDDFRATDDPDNVAVYFKLIRFPQQNLGMIVVRGTSNYWDMVRYPNLSRQRMGHVYPFSPSEPSLPNVVVRTYSLQTASSGVQLH